MTTRLLQGLRVVDATEVWAGPTAGSLLGDLGADVIKVESFPRNAMTRPLRDGPAVAEGAGPPYERSAIHHLANRNKRNVAIDLSTPGGADAMRRLLASADVFIEGYSAGAIAKLGFGWDDVRALNPRLVMISAPGWGVAGPYAGYVTLGSGLDAAAGHTALRGDPARPLSDVAPIFHSDATGALALVQAAISGLHRREQTARGVYIDLSQGEVLLWHLAGQVLEWTMNGRRPGRAGNADPVIVPHGCYPAAGHDAWVTVAAEDDMQWARLAGAMGHPEWCDDAHDWATVVGRLGARAAIDDAIAAWTREREPQDIEDALGAAGVIVGVVRAPAMMLAHPQLQARGWFQFVSHPAAGDRFLPGFPMRSRSDPPAWDRPCGLVGEHNRDVLAEIGLSAEEIERLHEAGAIGDAYG